jgi:hypothetical protein
MASVSKTYAPGGTSLQREREHGCSRSAVANAQEHPMLDVLMLALGFALFAAGIGYAYACERL